MMLFAAHPDALYENLVLSEVDPFDNAFAHSRLCVTNQLLTDYDRRFTEVTERQLLASLLGSLGPRLKVIRPGNFERVSSLGSELQAAANYGGKNLVLATGTLLGEDDRAVLDSAGIRFGILPGVFEATCQIGFSPFERFALTHGSRESPECIARFFRGEASVTFYDKFVGEPAISLINYLLPFLSAQCKVTIVTTRQGLPAQVIRGSLNPRAGQKIVVEHADASTTERLHDRHIFIGKHYQMHVPRGLDLFGLGPNWLNLNGEIAVYDCSEGKDIEMRFLRQGNAQRAPLRLKASVVA